MTNQKQKTVEAYDKNAQFYAESFDMYGARKLDIDRAFKLNASVLDHVLELGCANGRDAGYIVSEKRYTCNYLGIDASAGLIKIAKQNNPGLEFHVKDMLDFDYSGDSFGIILAFYSMLHVNREDLAKLLVKCGETLKTGGVLYVSSKLGTYKEIEIENLGSKKYYYAYEPADLERFMGNGFEVAYKTIHDSEYGPSFTIAFKKIR